MKVSKPTRVKTLIVPERLEQMGCRGCHYLIELTHQDDGTFLVICDKGRYNDPPHVTVDWNPEPYHTPPPATECFAEWHDKRYRHP